MECLTSSNFIKHDQILSKEIVAYQYSILSGSNGIEGCFCPVSTSQPVACLTKLKYTLFYIGGWTFTHTALNLAHNQLFTAAKGARANVAKVRDKVIRFTDHH